MYYLTPVIHPNWHKVIKDKLLINKLINSAGSPLNLLIPENATENYNKLSNALSKHIDKFKIFYAAKANKSNMILKNLSTTKIFVDVASLNELRASLAFGFEGSRIEATGPKNNEFLSIAIQHNVLINLDDINELTQIKQILEKLKLNRKVSILFRLNEFESSNKILNKDFRFGNRKDEIINCLKELDKNTFELVGFAMHIPTTSLTERIIGLENLLHLYFDSLKMGFNPKMINIGGAFANNFLQSEEEWGNYISALKNSIINTESEKLSWNDSGLGYWSEKGKIRGSARFSHFFIKSTPESEITQILTTTSETYGMKFADILNENNIELAIEPGRAMLDQVGITVARIINIKKSLQGENLLVLDMNRSNLNSQDLEFMSDPILLSNSDSEIQTSFSGFLVGNLCLPHDFITRRKVFFKSTPKTGDLLVFINTAGYFMDFDESETLRQPLAKKFALKVDEDIEWFEDSQFPIF